MKPSNNLENEISSDQILLTSQGFLWISYPAWDSQWILHSFITRRKSDIWVIESKFARKVFRKRFCLIRCRRQLLMAGRIAYLSFLRALLAVLLACFFFWTRKNNFLIKKCLSFWWFFLLLSYVPKSTYLNSF